MALILIVVTGKNLTFNLILGYITKKLIIEFVFHQICKRNGCNHTFLFKVPLSVVVFLSCGTSIEVHFQQIVNFEMLKFIGNRELSNIKELCNQESNELSNLREL